MIIHLIGLTQEEAEASIDYHGEIGVCSRQDCHESTEAMLLFKRPGSPWLQDIIATAACTAHHSDLKAMINEVSHPAKIQVIP
jgi:hypothetical protein